MLRGKAQSLGGLSLGLRKDLTFTFVCYLYMCYVVVCFVCHGDKFFVCKNKQMGNGT